MQKRFHAFGRALIVVFGCYGGDWYCRGYLYAPFADLGQILKRESASFWNKNV